MTNPASAHRFRNIALFQGLTVAQLTQVGQVACRQTVPAGTQLITAGQPGEAVCIILRGAVEVSFKNHDGTPPGPRLWGPGAVLNDMGAAAGPGQLASAMTREVTSLLWLHRHTLHDYLDTMPALQRNLNRILTQQRRHYGPAPAGAGPAGLGVPGQSRLHHPRAAAVTTTPMA